ncbi:FAD-dependent oxidoreductase [Sphingomonas sp. S1-29]|uniref:NAD(P)/FAD-dependent oxidoreductase n=1 Tax=Sphingomonas sp. S1-29 TaxID=2991074 RepID=UPI00223FFB86|nr:NAD(P)-binding protein [Sphingomonas sp. S1-29]UZK70865.1 FAD-dependent oxidoreductase [Sphingomonas sp. S1-29]
MDVAIIGAGIAGLACADQLAAAGHRVALFDKGRGPGGRMSTRRVDHEGATYRFDHGAQYFTARDPDFAAQVALWEAAGIAARWPAAGDDAWVGTPGMNAPVRAMADAHPVEWGARIEALTRTPAGWQLDARPELYAAVVVAVPAEQVAALVAPHAPDLAEAATATASEPCWTLMAAFDRRVAVADDVIRGATGEALGWAARDGAKPGRAGGETWVVQAGSAWSAEHLEETADAIVPHLLAALAARAEAPLPPTPHAAAHRWRYARTTGCGAGPAWRADIGLGLCGDWREGPRVEAAWASGRKLARMIG